MEIFVILSVIVGCVLLLAFCIAVYVVNSIGLSRAAKQNGVKNTWLAWIPVAKSWLLGSTAQAIDAKRGINRKWGKILLALYIVAYAIYIPAYLGFFVYTFIQSMTYGPVTYGSDFVLGGFAVALVLFYCVMFVSCLVLMVAGSAQLICIYKIFENFVPEKSFKYFVLSLLVPMAYGVCLMKCCPKNKTIAPSDGTYDSNFTSEN